MKAKILLGLIVLIVLFVLSIYFLFIYHQSIPKNIYNLPHSQITPQKEDFRENQPSWLDSFTKKSSPYSYPATEIKIGVEFKNANEKNNATKIVIDQLDDYKFSCLNEIFKQEKIEFAYYQSKDFINMVVFLSDKIKKEQILRDLRYYEIQYKLQ